MSKSANRKTIISKVNEFLKLYHYIYICNINDIPNKFIHEISHRLIKIKSAIVCGNTMYIREAFQIFIDNNPILPNDFTKDILTQIEDVIVGFK